MLTIIKHKAMRDFRKYEMWISSINLVSDIYQLLKKFPSYETFGLSEQLRRASISISSNIAEGSSRSSPKDFSHFLQISIGSAFEVETQLIIAKNLNYITADELKSFQERLCSIERQINHMISILK